MATEPAGTITDPRLVNPLAYEIYRPPGTETENLPAILMLHGHGGSERQWEVGGRASVTLQRLIDAGDVEPHLLVMPGVANSWYVTSEAYGAIDQVILERLLPEIEVTYGVSRWAVVGLSMGGYGALRLAFEAPERFEFVAALSPAIFKPGTSFGEQQLQLFNQAYGAPFEPAAYAQQNPFNTIPSSLPPIYLSVGDDDYFHLEEGTFEMFLALKRAGHSPELRVLDGGHSWTLWRAEFETVLRELAAKPRVD